MMIDFLMFDPPLKGNHLKLPQGACTERLAASARSRGRPSMGSAAMALGRVTAGIARTCLDAGAAENAVRGETMRSADPGESTRESSSR
jgi:hypothetical protein